MHMLGCSRTVDLGDVALCVACCTTFRLDFPRVYLELPCVVCVFPLSTESTSLNVHPWSCVVLRVLQCCTQCRLSGRQCSTTLQQFDAARWR